MTKKYRKLVIVFEIKCYADAEDTGFQLKSAQ